MKDAEKKLVEFQILSSGYEQLEEKEKELLEAKAEIEMSLNAIKDFSTIKKEKDVLINFGAGNYVSGKILPSEKILVSVGAGVVVEKSVKEAIELMEERKKSVEDAIEEVRKEREKVAIRLASLREEIENLRKSEK